MKVNYTRRLPDYLWPATLGLGILLRLVVYWQNRSLFLDEANLAHNIAERSLIGLFAPLDHQQYAPPLFLALEKLNWWFAGPAEWALRCWPLAMGIAALYGCYLLFRKVVNSNWSSLFVFYLFASSQVYVRYATELKQYSTDMAVTSGLIWLAIAYPPEKGKGIWTWMIAGSVAVWLSMPSVFVLSGIGAYFLFRSRSAQSSFSYRQTLLLGLMWLVQFGLYYVLILRADLQKTDLLQYHQAFFWPILPEQAEDWRQIWQLTESLLGTLIGHTIPALLIGIAGLLAGAFKLWRNRKGQLLLFLLPFTLCLLASGLGHYSLMERLSLFVMPLLGLVLACGLDALWQLSAWGKVVLTLLFLAVLPLRKGPEYFIHPLQYEEMRPLLQALGSYSEGSTYFWIDHHAQPAFDWYRYRDTRPGFPQLPENHYFYNAWDGSPVTDIQVPAGETGRIWLIFSHLVSDFNLSEMQADLEAARKILGEPAGELRYPGVRAVEFVLQ